MAASGPRRSEEAPFKGFATGGGSGGVSLWLAPEPVALDSNSFSQFVAMRRNHCCHHPNRKEGQKAL